MFELHIDPNADVTSGSIPVSWCVDKQLLADLAKKHILDPQVVIVVSPESYVDRSQETRVVAPLKDLMTYVPFRYPGKNNIRGFVSLHSKTAAKTLYLSRYTRRYSTTTLTADGSNWNLADITDAGSVTCITPKYQSQTISVNIPKECFAAEPAQWEKSWIEWLLRDKGIDQCDFRRRRLFAYTVQPIFLLIKIAVCFLFTLFAGLFGSRGFSLKYLFHPIRYEVSDLHDMMQGGSIYIRELDDTLSDKQSFWASMWWFVRKFCLLPLFPPIAVLIVLAVYFHVVLQVCAFAVAALLTFMVLMFLGTGGLSYLLDKLTASKTTWYLDQENQDLLVCGERRAPLTVGAIPFGKKTIHLRYQELKSKLCKPFAG